MITTGIENEWNYSWQDFVSIAISSLVSGVVSRVTRNQFLKAGGRKVLERTHKFVGTVSKRILTGYYDNSVDIISKALKSSFGQVWKKVIDLNFGEKFYKDWLMTLLQALFSVSFSRGLNGLK